MQNHLQPLPPYDFSQQQQEYFMPGSRAVIVRELSEIEARALCARLDIQVFWPRPTEMRA